MLEQQPRRAGATDSGTVCLPNSSRYRGERWEGDPSAGQGQEGIGCYCGESAKPRPPPDPGPKEQKPQSLGEDPHTLTSRAQIKTHRGFISSRRKKNPLCPSGFVQETVPSPGPIATLLDVSYLLMRMWARWSSHTLPVEIQNNSATLESNLATFYEVTHTLAL